MLYAHANKGSISRNLCPVDDELLGSGQDKGYVFPEADRPTITRGQKLGLVGNSGESTGAHLHVHKQTDPDGDPQAMPFERGMIADFTATEPDGDCNGTADINKWTPLKNSAVPQKTALFWPPTKLHKEYTRSRFDEGDFGRLFAHLTDSGYRLDWIDGYSVGGEVLFNHIWKKADTPWRAFFGLAQADFEKKLDEAKADGFAPVHLDSYLRNGQVRYAIVFHKNQPGQWLLRSNRTGPEHQTIFDQAKQDGLRPVAISVVSVGGDRSYSALYRADNLGSWAAKSTVAEDEYQAEFNANRAAGRAPIYLNAYMHTGKPFVSAIFASKPGGDVRARHRLSADGIQSEFDAAMAAGFETDVITAFDGANVQHRFFALWRK